jgi:hypothetical protein
VFFPYQHNPIHCRFASQVEKIKYGYRSKLPLIADLTIDAFSIGTKNLHTNFITKPFTKNETETVNEKQEERSYSCYSMPLFAGHPFDAGIL